MIIFKRIRFRNFMSYGNAWVDVDLCKDHITAITGKNGNGKSCIPNAICYALYGRPLNDAQKSKLVNSINGKNLLVEIEFDCGDDEYLVRRGQAPTVFEIHKNGVLIPELSSVKEYQELLENKILKVNSKTFRQTILIATSSFTPFMEMSTSDRRAVIENVLGVEVLSAMNKLVKSKSTELEKIISTINMTVKNLKVQVEAKTSQIETLIDVKKQSKQAAESKIQELKTETDTLTEKIETLNAQVQKLQPYVEKSEKINKVRTEIQSEIASIETLIKNHKKQLKFISNKDFCPFCQQNITEEHKTEITERTNSELSTQTEKYNSCLEKLRSYDEALQNLAKVITKIGELNREIFETNTKININRKSLNALESERDTPLNVVDDIDRLKNDVYRLADDLRKELENKEKRLFEQHLNDNAKTILLDSGIKSKIVHKYLPLINQKVNQYLDAMDFFISFNLDDEFNEVIKSRERDEFKYSNLSMGERRRLDVALILTWRYIIAKRAEYNSNLLFIDELLDSALDSEGIEAVMQLLQSLKNTNIFIITHNSAISDSRIDKYYKVQKINQFSTFEETTNTNL